MTPMTRHGRRNEGIKRRNNLLLISPRGASAGEGGKDRKEVKLGGRKGRKGLKERE